MRIAVTILFLFLAIPTFAQQSKVDSLTAILANTSDPQQQLSLLFQLSSAYESVDLLKAIPPAHKAYELASQLKDTSEYFHACNNLGLLYDMVGKNDSVTIYFEEAFELAKQLDSLDHIVTVLNNLGIYYLDEGDYVKALGYLQDALIYVRQSTQKTNLSSLMTNIGIIHDELGNHDKAILYYKKAAAEAQKAGDKLSIAYADMSLGYVLYEEEKYKQALEYLKAALKTYQQEGIALSEAEVLFYIGALFAKQKKYELALKYQLDALAVYERLNSVNDLPTMYTEIGKIFEATNNSSKADIYFEKALDFVEENELLLELSYIYKTLIEVAEARKDYPKAYEYLKRSNELRDTLFSPNQKVEIDALEAQYNLKIKETENEKLKALQIQKEAKLRQRGFILIGTTLLALSLGTILLFYYRMNHQKNIYNQGLEQKVAERTAELQATNAKLTKINEELEKFTYITSHDLKEPLRNIASFVNLIQRRLKNEADQDLQDYMEYVVKNTKQMYGLVEDVLAFSRVDNEERVKLEKVDLQLLLTEIISSIKIMIRERNGVVDVKQLPTVLAHRTHLFLIFKNLIENGIKYNESAAPIIVISHIEKDGLYEFIVRDNGIGIAEKYHDQIFDMFKRLNKRDEYTGSGIGLAICKKIIEKYNGDIWLESTLGKGTAFHFTIPKESQA